MNKLKRELWKCALIFTFSLFDNRAAPLSIQSNNTQALFC
jgi:hypothetical protein